MCWQLAAAVPVAGVTALSALLCCPALKHVYMSNTQHAGDSKNSSSGVQSVLILGASGGVGSFAVLLAKHFFRIPLVTATCSGRNSSYVHQLGADVVVDYTSQDVETAVLEALQQQQQQQLQEHSVQQGVPVVAASAADASSSSAGVSVAGSTNLDLVIDDVGGLGHMRMAGRLLKPGTGLYVTSVPLADPSSSSFLSVMQFFGHLILRKILHRVLPGRFPGVAFNGASPDGAKMQWLVDWLAAAGSGVEVGSAGRCLVRLTEFDLEGMGEALAVLQSGRAVGKMVVKVNGT